MSLSTNRDSCVVLPQVPTAPTPGLPGSAAWAVEESWLQGRAWPSVAERVQLEALGPGSQTGFWGCDRLGGPGLNPALSGRPGKADASTGGGREPLIRAAADTEASISLID